MSLFFSQPFKPHVIWSLSYQVHPNNALSTTRLSCVAQQPASIAPYFSAMIGLPPVSGDGGSVIYRTQRGETVEILEPAALGARFAGRVPACSALSAYGIGLRFAVADLAACRDLLARNGVPMVETSGGL